MPSTIKKKTNIPVCPKDPNHGVMILGEASMSFARGIGDLEFPIDLKLSNLPAFVCQKCAEDDQDTFEMIPEFDTAIANAFVSPIKKCIDYSLRKYKLHLPTLILDFGKHQNKSAVLNSKISTNSFRVTSPRFGFERVLLPPDTKKSLLRCVALLKKEKLVFDKWKLDSVLGGIRQFTLNFFGPSGTGKTLTAEALAKELGLGFLQVNYAQLESKWVGETPKNIERVFKLAEKKRALLFFDEADSFLGKRLTQVNQSADYAVNVTRSVMLMEMEKYTGIAVFATNLIENYDKAFARRFMLSIYFGIPEDERTLSKLWQIHLPEEVPLAEDVDCGQLAREFCGLTGGDIRNAVLGAVLEAAASNLPDAKKRITHKSLSRMATEVLRVKQMQTVGFLASSEVLDENHSENNMTSDSHVNNNP